MLPQEIKPKVLFLLKTIKPTILRILSIAFCDTFFYRLWKYNQYRTDVDKLITEKNMRSESLTSTEYSDFEEELAPLEVCW